MVQVPSMTTNTIPMTYQIKGPYTHVHEACHKDVMITITIDVILIPLKENGNVACMCVQHLV